MIYEVLKPFVKLSLHTFFRKIEVIGKEYLELDKPIIFVSNHPNAFLDPLVFLIMNPHKEHFIAGAEWFGNGFKNWLFRKEFNMIPVVRPWLMPNKKATNDEMFFHCYECLAKNGRIVIYPEGTSVTVTKIRELKTGAARIKIGADNYMSAKDTLIIPVGINYSNPRRFQSEVVINVGPPIDFSDLPEAEEKEKAALMTEKIHQKMSELVLHYEDTDHTPLAVQVIRIYGSSLETSIGIQDHETERKFKVRQDVLKAILHFEKAEPAAFTALRSDIEKYFILLKKKGIEASRVTPDPDFPWLIFTKVVLLLPPFLIGFIFNGLPFSLTTWLFTHRIKSRISEDYETGKLNPSFIGSLTFLLGMAIFTIWYAVLSIGAWLITGFGWVIPLVIIAGYFTGLISLKFARINYRLSQQLRLRRFRRQDREGFNNLLEKRKRMLDQLDQYRDMFRKTTENRS